MLEIAVITLSFCCGCHLFLDFDVAAAAATASATATITNNSKYCLFVYFFFQFYANYVLFISCLFQARSKIYAVEWNAKENRFDWEEA